MEKQNMRETIKQKAIEIFSAKGFHGTTIREIAREAGCSLPMLYYYYKSKNDLFDEVACNEFLQLTERMNAGIPAGLPLEELYFRAVKQRKELNDYDRAVYKLSMKVWLGFDGSSDTRERLVGWEEGRLERTRRILAKACEDENVLEVFSRIMVRIIENMTEKIILLEEDISDEDIRKEIEFMLNSVKRV